MTQRSASPRFIALDTHDIRFPTSRSFDGLAFTFGLIWRSSTSTSRCTRTTASTASLTSSMRRRFIVSVNSIRRIARDTAEGLRAEYEADSLADVYVKAMAL